MDFFDFLKVLKKTNLYYWIKPLLPRWFQVCIRRIVIRRKKQKYQDIWPINQNAYKVPHGWRGWPDGKKFALVLTHDLESGNGYKKIPDLIALEEKHGFTSSYNIIPERYEVTPDIREFIVNKGFELGVHGLYHDGKLYRSLNIFKNRAEIINRYLAEWNVVGFRAPAMHHNLNWNYYLDIEYDASTFDTDPFEPQSDSIDTIFPVKIITCQQVNGRYNCKSYIELPYTLPQDFSLFILLRENNIDVWKKKLDWVAEKGGMVLINTHPDYMCFDGLCKHRENYPSDFYEQLLIYVKEKYPDQYWHVLPRDMARYWMKFTSDDRACNESSNSHNETGYPLSHESNTGHRV